MGKPSSGKDDEDSRPKGTKGKDAGKLSKGKGKAWSAYRTGETEANYRHVRETRAMRGLKRVSRSTLAKSRDRPGTVQQRAGGGHRSSRVRSPA